MARTKSPAMQRTPSEIKFETNGTAKRTANGRTNVSKMLDRTLADDEQDGKRSHGTKAEAGVLNLLLSVAAIYASFLTWAVLQERITTTSYGFKKQRWNYPLFLNTVQSALAFVVGTGYRALTTSHPHRTGPAPMFPSLAIAKPIALVAITSSLASPFGYASLKHIDYITFILAKSCKLLPVMFLHVTLFRRKFPLHKYAVVVLVTLGVSLFTLYSSGAAAKAAKHASKSSNEANKLYGLLLLGINLLFDGLTNTVQDNIFASYKPYGGAQMMCAMNIMATLFTTSYLFLAPYLSSTPLGPLMGTSSTELTSALAFIRAHPQVGWDVLGFSLCGAIGQVAIYHMLATFGSIPLTTVTVTRKMLTMVLSVLWFGHRITGMQWVGVGSVFGGIGAEAGFKILEKRSKTQKAKDRSLSEAGKKRVAAGIGGKKDR